MSKYSMDTGHNMFISKANWIWLSKPQKKYNNIVCFRKGFTIASVDQAGLKITADARYEVHINGKWIGNGPARSWVNPWPVDIYNISKYLQKGKNVIAVIVHDYGIGTNQYIYNAPGLIVQMELKTGKRIRTIVTDKTWKVCNNNAFAMPAPQLSFQQPWEEQFDASNKLYDPVVWRSIEYNDSKWDTAVETAKVGQGGHSNFFERSVPFLTREKIAPKRLISVEAIDSANFIWSLNLRAFFEDRGSGDLLYRSLLLHTYIYSPLSQTIKIQDPHELSVWPSMLWKINGIQILGNDSRFDSPIMNWGDSRTIKVKLNSGWNTLLGRHIATSVVPRAIITIKAEKLLKFSAIQDIKEASENPWLVIGPFAPSEQEKQCLDRSMPDIRYPTNIHPKATSEIINAIWENGRLMDADCNYPFTKKFSSKYLTNTDVFAISLSDKKISDVNIKIENKESFLYDNCEYTTIYPNKAGDIRLLIDFDKELVGYHEFEVNADKGTVLDFINFEFIQPDGRINLCEGMNNTFRYLCRQGYQKYRTFLRRGFRYSYLTIRNLKKPIKIHHINAIFNTYPFTYNGDFRCSDEKLNRIWQAGVHTLRCCSEDAYTDCPTYEQAFWVGDGRNEALVDFVVNGDPRLSANSLMLAAHSLQRSDITESHSPSTWKGIIPAWSFLWMRWAQEHYQFTGDKKFSHEILRYIKKNVDGIKKYINYRGLIQITAWNMFDWAPMDTPADGIVTHNNCLAVLALNQCAKLADQLGNKKYSKDWRDLASSLRKTINKHLWSDKKKAYYDCIHADGKSSAVFSQQTHVAAYIAGIPTKDRIDRCWSIIHNAPSGFVQAGSPFFMFFLLEILANGDHYEDMINLIRDYWGRQIDAGANTFWEMYTPEANRLTRSHCHGWSAAPTFFLSHYILGVQPLEPGYEKVLIAPKIAGLKWARGTVPTPYGNINCKWELDDGVFSLKIKLPKKVQTQVKVPFNGKVEIIEGKSATIKKEIGIIAMESNKENEFRIRLSCKKTYLTAELGDL